MSKTLQWTDFFKLACDNTQFAKVIQMLNDSTFELDHKCFLHTTQLLEQYHNPEITIAALRNKKFVHFLKSAEPSKLPLSMQFCREVALYKEGHLIPKATSEMIYGVSQGRIAIELDKKTLAKKYFEEAVIEAQNRRLDKEDSLIEACRYNRFSDVAQIIKEGKINLNTKIKDGSTVLHIACLFSDLKIVKALLDTSKMEYRQNGAGITPLHCAAERGHLEIVQIFAKCNINEPSNDELTPLFIACREGHVSVVKFLLQQETIDVNKAYNNGKTPLAVAAQYCNIEIINTLLAHDKIKINTNISPNITAFLLACSVNTKEQEAIINTECNLTTLPSYELHLLYDRHSENDTKAAIAFLSHREFKMDDISARAIILLLIKKRDPDLLQAAFKHQHFAKYIKNCNIDHLPPELQYCEIIMAGHDAMSECPNITLYGLDIKSAVQMLQQYSAPTASDSAPIAPVNEPITSKEKKELSIRITSTTTADPETELRIKKDQGEKERLWRLERNAYRHKHDDTESIDEDSSDNISISSSEASGSGYIYPSSVYITDSEQTIELYNLIRYNGREFVPTNNYVHFKEGLNIDGFEAAVNSRLLSHHGYHYKKLSDKNVIEVRFSGDDRLCSKHYAIIKNDDDKDIMVYFINDRRNHTNTAAISPVKLTNFKFLKKGDESRDIEIAKPKAKKVTSDALKSKEKGKDDRSSSS